MLLPYHVHISQWTAKLNEHLPSVKVNLNSSFGGGPWVYVGTSRQLQPAYGIGILAEFLSKVNFFMPQGGLADT